MRSFSTVADRTRLRSLALSTLKLSGTMSRQDIVERVIDPARELDEEALRALDPEVCDLWCRIRAQGPFDWVRDLDALFVDAFGEVANGTWITFRAAVDISDRGWVRWSFPVSCAQDLRLRAFPADNTWIRGVFAQHAPENFLKMVKMLRDASGEPPTRFRLSLEAASAVAKRALADGIVRIRDPHLSWLLYGTPTLRSMHARVSARARISALPELPDLEKISLMSLVSMLEDLEGGPADPARFRAINRDIALLIAEGDIPAPEYFRSDAERWFDQ